MIEAQSLPEPGDRYPVRRALLSVYDKSGIVPLARGLHEQGVELISTGGTARKLREASLPVTDVADLTGYPHLLEGRVKTLHPAVHAGILARRNAESDMDELDEHSIAPIDLVVANLYPFQQAIQGGANAAEAVENIDIGGPTMVRAAAKNYFFVGVVTSPDDYEIIIDELAQNDGQLSMALRRRLARKAFAHTAAYDQAIARYFAEGTEASSSRSLTTDDPLPATLILQAAKAQDLRYGENPHQEAALYGRPNRFFEQLHGKDLSYNNLMDLSAALLLIDEFRDDDPTCAILKHTNPCGVATADRLEAAYQRAFSTDRQSPFGGIVVVNRALDRATAEAIDQIFTEVIIAPAYEEGVLEFLKQKKRRRLIESRAAARTDDRYLLRSVLGGVLVQEQDPVLLPLRAQRDTWEVATERAPTDKEMLDLNFAWRVVKHVKSNAIVYAKNRATLGIGAGQMSRIDASELAVRKGKKSELDFSGSVVASDAFFPFADGLLAAADSGARAAIQPGGSIRDEEVVRAANERDLAMVLTGTRHFRH